MILNPRLKLIAGGIGLAGLAIAAHALGFQSSFQASLEWMREQGPGGVVVFVAAYVLACVTLVPGSLLSIGAGVIYGVAKGTVVVSIGATIGATAAFLIGRHLARDWVSAKLAGNTRFAAIDKAVGADGWKIVGLTRLSPLFPFNLLNYAFGLTSVSTRDYVLATFVGTLPGTVLFVYIGSVAGDLSGVNAGGRTRSPVEWTLYGIGLAATVAVTVLVTRIAKRALREKLEKPSAGTVE